MTLVSFSQTTERNTCISNTHLLQFLNLNKVRNCLQVIHTDAKLRRSSEMCRASLAAAASGSCRNPLSSATTDQLQVEGGGLSPPFWSLQTWLQFFPLEQLTAKRVP